MRTKRVLPLVLATGLQFMPMARTALPLLQSPTLAPAWAIVLRVAAGVVALIGSCHAVSAATAIAGSKTINAAVGTRFTRQLATSGQTAHSWSAATAPLDSTVYPLTPGLYLTNKTGKIGGIPTQAASSSIKITAWENSGNSGSKISATFTFNVTGAAGLPVITRQVQNLTITAGQKATFSVEASGADPMSYFWRKGATVIGVTSSGSFTLANAQVADAGTYLVIVSNTAGTAISSPFTLVVNPPLIAPFITAQPTNRTALAGTAAAFSVTSGGSAPLGYQWRFNGTPMAGKTSTTLTLASVQPANAGGYSVVVTNAAGAVTSTVATLTVTLPPDLTKPTVTIAAPGVAPLVVTSNRFRMTGQAKDNVSISNVWVLPASGAAIIATGTTNWAVWVDLMPGTNLFRVKALDQAGNSSGTNTLRTIVFLVMSPLTLSKSGNGSMVGATNGQPLAIGRNYTLTATPGLGYLFSNWIGSATSSSNVLRFAMQSNFTLTAQFVPNPFPAAAGNYNGLYYDPANLQHGSAGFATVKVLPTGSFSASLRNGLKKFPFTGRFDLNGRATSRVARARTNALTVELNLDLQGGNRIIGRVTDGAWSSSLSSDRAVFQATTNPAIGFATNYTLLMPGAVDATVAPPGDGFAAMKVARSGVATLAGTLADASPLAQKPPVSGTGDIPLYVSLYGGKGSIFGWLHLRPTAEIDLDGIANWVRPRGPAPKIYTNGFVLSSAVEGSIYSPPGTNHLFDLDTAFVEFNAGNLAAPFTNTVALGPNSRVTNTSPNKLTLAVTPATGLFAGSVTQPGATRVLSFKGAILQRQGMGGGYFPGTNQSGRVYFGP